jgi:hypothetical protein
LERLLRRFVDGCGVRSISKEGGGKRAGGTAVPPLPPHAPAVPQLPHWGKITDRFMME